MVKNIYVQTTSKGCSLHCLSNMFNYPFVDFLTDKTGELNQIQENQILQIIHPGIELRPMAYKNGFLTSMKWTILSECIEWLRRQMNESRFAGLMLTLNNNGVLHSVNLYVSNDSVMISDPLRKGTVLIKGHSNALKNYLMNRYKGIHRISTYCKITESKEDELIMFDKSRFEHLYVQEGCF